MGELTVVLCKWQDKHHNYGGKFDSAHVNALAGMIRTHYPDQHRIVCFTDDPDGIDSRIEVHPIWDDYAALPNPTGGGRPSCYRRLKLWSKDMLQILGPRFVHLDLDTVVCGDLRPLWNRPEPLVMYKDYHERWPYAGGTYMMDTGKFACVWEQFDPVTSPRLASHKGYQGSDQAWLNYILPPDLPSWHKEDGIYRQLPRQFAKKPYNARIVFTTGLRPPWGQDISWMREAFA